MSLSILVSNSIDFSILGILIEPERDDRRMEKLSLRKQLKRKCQEQHNVAPMYDRAEINYQPRKDSNCSYYELVL